MRNLALSIPCDEHGTPVNVYCFVSVKGLCRPRIDAAVVLVNARAEADS